MTKREQLLFDMYKTLDFPDKERNFPGNEVCQKCREYVEKYHPNGANFSKPLSAYVVGEHFDDNATRLLFVGKAARGDGWDERTDFCCGFVEARRLWPKYSSYWSYTSEIAAAIYGNNSIENIAMTNLIKCNDSDNQDTTSDYTKKSCICKLGVIRREIDIIGPSHIIFYTGQHYDGFIGKIFDSSTFDPKDKTRKSGLLWQEAIGELHKQKIQLLRTGHPQSKNKEIFINEICNWINRTN